VNYAIKQPTQYFTLDHGVRHDLRNQIACLGLDVELLSRRGEAHDQDCPCCRVGRSAGARAMKSMQRIEALLLNAQSQASAAKIAGKVPRDGEGIEAISVRETIADAVEALEPIIPPGMRIALGVAPEVMARANPIDVFRIALNLLRNVIDVAVESGEELHVRITAETVRGRTSVMVSDNGPGLPAPIQHQFQLAVKAPQGGNRGRGQGLAISRYLARRNDGRLLIAATNPLGTIFEIVLPAGAKAT
jgi:C4-dicarboxylate-specific signal transduction histidine kinase